VVVGAAAAPAAVASVMELPYGPLFLVVAVVFFLSCEDSPTKDDGMCGFVVLVMEEVAEVMFLWWWRMWVLDKVSSSIGAPVIFIFGFIPVSLA
jgi:hypothetical protein